MQHGLASALKDRMPALRGRLEQDVPLRSITWFRVGGPAELLFHPEDIDDLAYFLSLLPPVIPILVIGLCSNLLVREGGIPGVVIKLGRGFGKITIEDNNRVRAEAGVPDTKVARAAADAGIAGLAFLRGIPGAIGGLLRMNAGAYGKETSQILVSAKALDRTGVAIELSLDDMQYEYRHSGVSEDLIFVEGLFQGMPGDKDVIRAEMKDITEAREESQPVKSHTGGSTFKNPDGHKAWQLIDDAGCRGLQVGGAQVSEKHCNFLINNGDATATDLETLGETVRRRVKETSGIDLEWEIRRIGIPAIELEK
ncbi:MAG: UDP-N-acetylmuramate dehydrogenase [Rhizobiales bacterium]|nr:UDP-N-acetylmuramate dehydrogenase [Hyphomicrobiales bacterium]